MFRFNDTQAVSFSDQQPEKVDVVIIGGGIIGISSAWYLLNQGLSVFVAEKGRVAGEQSSRNWGWVRVTWRDEAEVPVAIDSLKCWKEITSEIDEDTGFTVGGIIGLARSEQEFAEFAALEYPKLLDANIAQDNLIRRLFFSGIIMILIFIVIVLYLLSKKKKSGYAIEQQGGDE